jgi:hypothetical protein
MFQCAGKLYDFPVENSKEVPSKSGGRPMDLKAVRLTTGGKAEKNRQIVVCVKNVGAKPLLCPDMVRLIGIEPTHPAPEAGALSTELQAHTLRCDHYYSIVFLKRKEVFFKNSSAEKA